MFWVRGINLWVTAVSLLAIGVGIVAAGVAMWMLAFGCAPFWPLADAGYFVAGTVCVSWPSWLLAYVLGVPDY